MTFKLRLIVFTLTIPFLFFPSLVFSEEFSESEYDLADFYGDEDFVSIATGKKQLIYKAPSVATVITAKQIEDSGALTVAEVLERVPGLHVYPSPFNRLNTSFSLRGIHTDQNPQVLFLINGSPIREEYTGARPQTFKMPVHSISRIEIIRGPGSAIYGADAYSGVINIITKTVEELKGAYYGLSYGSFETTNAWYQGAFSFNEFDIGIGIETLKSDGDDSRIMERDLQSIFDEFFNTNSSNAPGSLSTNYNIVDFRATAKTKSLKADFWFWKNKNAGQGAGASQALDPSGVQNTSVYQLGIEYDKSFSSWDSKFKYGYYHLKDRAQFSVLPAGTLVPIGGDGNLNLVEPVGLALFVDGYLGNPQPTEKLHSFDVVFLSKSLNEHNFRIGTGGSRRDLSAKEEKNFGPGVLDVAELKRLADIGEVLVVDNTLVSVSNTSYIFVNDAKRTNWYLSLQDQWKFLNDWELTSGIRFDYYDDFGMTINPRLALVWETNQSITSKVLYGRAFRAPAFDTLYAINNPVGIGNPNLKPEIIDTLEIGLNQQVNNNFHWALNTFYYESRDLIEFVLAEAKNDREQDGHGAELEVGWKNDNVQLDINYSIQNSKDAKLDTTIPMAPQSLFNTNFSYNIADNFKIVTNLNWVGKRAREEGDIRKELSEYSTMDLSFQWKFGEQQKWQVSIIGKNIFDESAYEPTHPMVPSTFQAISDYPIQQRSFYIRLAGRL